MEELEAAKRDLIVERVVPQAVAYWEEVLTVVNPVDNIKLNRCRNHE